MTPEVADSMVRRAARWTFFAYVLLALALVSNIRSCQKMSEVDEYSMKTAAALQRMVEILQEGKG